MKIMENWNNYSSGGIWERNKRVGEKMGKAEGKWGKVAASAQEANMETDRRVIETGISVPTGLFTPSLPCDQPWQGSPLGLESICQLCSWETHVKTVILLPESSTFKWPHHTAWLNWIPQCKNFASPFQIPNTMATFQLFYRVEWKEQLENEKII